MISIMPVCMDCIRYNWHDFKNLSCAAFPEKIPDEVILRGNPHTSHIIGDHGLLFKASTEVHDDKWITTKSKNGEGKNHILLSDNGEIKGGAVPKSAQGKTLKEAFTELKSKHEAKKSKAALGPGTEPYKPPTGEKPAISGVKPGEKQQISPGPEKVALGPGKKPDKMEELVGMMKEHYSKNPESFEEIERQSNRLKKVLYGSSTKSVQYVSEENRKKAKKDVEQILGKALSKNEEFRKYCTSIPGSIAYGADPKNVSEYAAGQAASELIRGWAATSADNNPKAIFMQQCAQKAFDLTDVDTSHLPKMLDRNESEKIKALDKEVGQAAKEVNDWYENTEEGKRYMALLVKQWSPSFTQEQKAEFETLRVRYREIARPYEEARKALAEFSQKGIESFGDDQTENAYKAFLKAQYDETQALFKKEGITHVQLYRGMTVEAPEKQGEAEMGLQPISSFSTSYEVARDFAGKNPGSIIIVATVPVEHILSTCKTGFGCLLEGEVTVLAHKMNGKYLSGKKGFPGSEDAFLEKLGFI